MLKTWVVGMLPLFLVIVILTLLWTIYLLVRKQIQQQLTIQLQDQQLNNFKDLYENAPIINVN